MAFRLAAGSPRDHRRLALRLQRQKPPRPRRTHPNRIRPTVDHDPPTPSRIATGPPKRVPLTSPGSKSPHHGASSEFFAHPPSTFPDRTRSAAAKSQGHEGLQNLFVGRSRRRAWPCRKGGPARSRPGLSVRQPICFSVRRSLARDALQLICRGQGAGRVRDQLLHPSPEPVQHQIITHRDHSARFAAT